MWHGQEGEPSASHEAQNGGMDGQEDRHACTDKQHRVTDGD